MKRNVVVIHPGALGDVCLAVPAIRKVASRFPRHHLLLIGRASVSRLLAECCVIDEWIASESQICSELFAGSGCQSKELRSHLHRCDMAVAWTEDVDGSLASTLQEFGVPDICIQSPFSPTLKRTHQRDRFLETIGESCASVLVDGAIQVPGHLLEEGRICLESKGIGKDHTLVLVHPGSGSIHKCLKPEKIADIIQRLQYRALSPVVLEGPADHETVEGVLRLLNKKPLVLQDLPLSLLTGVLANMDLYFGHDSGVTHLAAMLGVRTVAVFGPTDPSRWAPSGSHVTILRGASCVCPTWDAVKTCHGKPCLDLDVEETLTVLGVAMCT